MPGHRVFIQKQTYQTLSSHRHPQHSGQRGYPFISAPRPDSKTGLSAERSRDWYCPRAGALHPLSQPAAKNQPGPYCRHLYRCNRRRQRYRRFSLGPYCRFLWFYSRVHLLPFRISRIHAHSHCTADVPFKTPRRSNTR